MPQLDKVTYFSQVVTFIFIFVLLFVYLSAIVLPAIYRFKRIRVNYLRTLEIDNSKEFVSLCDIYKSHVKFFVSLDDLVSDIEMINQQLQQPHELSEESNHRLTKLLQISADVFVITQHN